VLTARYPSAIAGELSSYNNTTPGAQGGSERAVRSQKGQDMGKLTGFIITAGHLDIEWYQPLRSYRFWTVEALEDLKKAAARADFACYVLDGQVFPLLEYLDVVPEEEGAMRALIAEGRLKIGPFYTQFDEWLPSAENMIRNCLYGRREALRFGGIMRAGYLPDNFGHPPQMPQILNGFGIDSLLFMRGMPEVAGGHPDEFLYEGLDGSCVLASHFRESYAGAFDIFNKPIDPIQPREVPYYPDYLSFEYHKALAVHDDPKRIAKNLVENVMRIKDRYPSGIIPLIAGYDHLPPQINVGDSVAEANRMQDEIEFVMGDVEEYVRRVRARASAPAVYNMELTGSKYQYVLLGALSTRSYLKRQNFACEALLERYAEPLAAMAERLGYRPRPALFDEAWKFLLVNSAHDSIHGSSVDEVHVEMEARNAGVRQIASGIIHEAMAHMAGRMKPVDGRGCIVYAPVATSAPQIAEVWLAVGDGPVQMRTRDGRKLPTQVLPREAIELNGLGQPRNDAFPAPVFRKVVFMAPPSDGIEAYVAAPADAPEPDGALSGGDDFIENEFIRVTARGALIELFDKETGRLWPNMNLLEEEADAGDAWDFAPPWTPGTVIRSTAFDFSSRLVEMGGVRATLRIEGELIVPEALCGDDRSRRSARMPVAFDVSLVRGTRRADVKMTLVNTARDHRIRLRVPTGIKAETVLSQGHLAVLERKVARQKKIEPWLQPPTQLLPCREWLAVRDSEKGLAVALKGLYDYEAIPDPLGGGIDLAVTLVRGFQKMGRRNTRMREGAASEAFDTPGAQCLGEHVIEWAYLPYQPDEGDRAPFLPLAQSFLYPPVAHAIRTSGDPSGPERLSLPFRWSAPNVQFSAFKRAMDGQAFILRLYENQGRETTLDIHLPGFQEASLANLAEDPTQPLPIENGRARITLGRYKAVTLRLR